MRRWGVAAAVVAVALACTGALADTTQAPLTEAEQQHQERLEWVAKVLEKEGKYGTLHLSCMLVLPPTRK